MLWRGRRESGNVEDRRGFSGGRIVAGGGILGLVVYVLSLFLGGNISKDLSVLTDNQAPSQQTTAADDERAKFVRVVLAETEDVWQAVFRQEGKEYTEPVLVLFRERTESACGYASSATGPFYCPSNSQVYIDLSFFEELQNRFHAPGDFAMAYVIAHEVGHHVQHLLGISEKVEEMRSQMSEREFNQYSVKLELQADFLAGVWAHHAQEMDTLLEAGDIEEALAAANAIGDDRLQKQAQGYVVPDAFTHGTSQQRMYWFKKGWDSGKLSDGDTFHASSL
jgi:predicted metalloprotease